MMHKIWNQKSLWEVAKIFGVNRGWLQSTLQLTCTNAGAIARFSEVKNIIYLLIFLSLLFIENSIIMVLKKFVTGNGQKIIRLCSSRIDSINGH